MYVCSYPVVTGRLTVMVVTDLASFSLSFIRFQFLAEKAAFWEYGMARSPAAPDSSQTC